jgi:hypothetical protein
MAAQVKDAVWMEWVASLLEGASRQTRAAAFPPEQYYCLLDELPLHLLPQGSAGLLRQDLSGPLFLNPACLICPADQLSEELTSQPGLLSSFALQGMIAWIRHPVTESLLPFWLGSELESAVRSLRPGYDARGVLSKEDCRILVASGILKQADSPLPCESAESHEKLRNAYRDQNYVPFPALIHSFHVAALRRYYRCLIRKGLIRQRDPQCPQRLVAHNEPVARFFHHQLTKVVSAIACEPVKPSYVYFASYQAGAELKKHTDREQCEFSISLCLDFFPEPERETPWPLCLDTPKGKVEIRQALGDGLFYRGTRVPHYREALGDGLTSTSIFFHYVRANFDGSMD